MRKISIKLAVLAIILFTYSCVKDHSSLDIGKLNEVTITGIPDTITVSMGDTLIIKPVLETSKESGTTYDYLWYSFTTTMQFEADTLSYEKNIIAPIEQVPGTYSLVFRVMDRNTGVFYKSTVTMVVVNEFAPGIMILGEDNGKAVLDFLNTSSGKYITDVYKKSNNNEELGSNPLSVSYYAKDFSMPAEVLILCKDLRGGVFADPITFTKTRNFKNSFFVPLESSGNIDITKYVPKGGNLQDYVIIEGKAYNRAVNSGDLLFKPGLLASTDHYVSSQVFSESYTARPAFYDTIGRRFLGHNNTFGSLSSFKASATDNIINPNNVGLDIVYAGGVSSNDYFGLFKTPGTQDYYVLRMMINALSLDFAATEKYQMNGVDINRAAAFASSPSLANYFFYSVDSKCYVYNILTKSGGLLFDMGTDYSINFLELNNVELKVAFQNMSKADKKGGFATFNITTDGGIKATETRRKEGIMDKVVDLTDKK